MRFLRPILYMLFMGAACSGTNAYHKKAPGFTGVRGKRSVLQEDSTTDKDGRTVKNVKETNLEIQKRSPHELVENGERDKPFNGWIQDNNLQEGVFKRAPSASFFGMRGKKYFYDEWPDKRARLSNNFFGMRGKKQQFYPEYTSDNRLALANNFMGMHANKPYGEEEPSNEFMDEYASNDKRAPKFSASFFGMRGKKEDEEMRDIEDDGLLSEAEKRAKNLFFGMRGRRDLANSEMNEEKRAYNAFFGMRGKRTYEDYLDEPSMHTLYGMRGKKHRRRTNFFGMRGKKLPSEFRGKFVGVRGKKSVSPSDFTSTENEEDPIELQRVNSNNLDDLMFVLDEDKSNEQSGEEYNTLKEDKMTETD